MAAPAGSRPAAVGGPAKHSEHAGGRPAGGPQSAMAAQAGNRPAGTVRPADRQSQEAFSTVTSRIEIGCFGASGPRVPPIPCSAIRSTMSMPCTTRPKIE